MEDTDEQIPKPKTHLDRDAFTILFNLFRKQDWLEKKANETIELWNNCQDGKQQDLVVDLLHRFRMLKSNDIDSLCDNIAQKICTVWNLKAENTLLVAFADNQRPDGSQYFLQALKSHFSDYEGWREYNFTTNLKKITELPYTELDKKILVFFDDFIGTGRTADRKITWVQKKLEERKLSYEIRVVALAAMKEAELVLTRISTAYYIPILLEKGISDYYPIEVIKEKIQIMKDIEETLAPEYRNQRMPSLGYGESESLFSIEGGNVPNNVFPVFWWPIDSNGSFRRTILKRLI